MSLNFALDFDDTLTADPALWRKFIADARAVGHQVFIVTARRGEYIDEVREFLADHDIKAAVFFTSLGSKLEFAKRNNLRVDIWIDDHPESLVNGR